MEDLTRLTINRDDKKGLRPVRRRAGKYWLPVLVAVIVIAFIVNSKFLNPVPLVETANVVTAYPSQSLALFNATGYVVPQTRADVASKATGRLEILHVEEGNAVKKDQVLAQLENQDVTAVMERARATLTSVRAAVNQAQARHAEAQARVEEAEAELRDAERARKRTDELIGKKYVTPEVNDAAIARHEKAQAAIASVRAAVKASTANIASAEAEVTAAEAAAKEAEVAVEYTYIRAPFDGVILSKHADIGDVVAPFATSAQSKGSVVSMADLSTLQVETDVSESNLTMVQVGQPCEIQLDALPDVRLRGEVHMIVPTVDRTKATVLVKIRFVDKDERILPDMSARVAFLNRALVDDDKVPRIVVAPAAIVTRDGQSVVYRIEQDNIVRAVNVTTGGELGEMTIIKQGLNSGDRVVLNPPENLKDGMQVKLPTG